jgi:hypothetical protein
MTDRMIDDRKMNDLTRDRRPTREENEAFSRWLMNEHGTDELPADVESKLFAKAWEEGHADGYGEVALYYGDLADLVLLAYRAGRG